MYDFSQEQHMSQTVVVGSFMVHTLVCKMEEVTVHEPYKKQKNNFRVMCINK